MHSMNPLSYPLVIRLSQQRRHLVELARLSSSVSTLQLEYHGCLYFDITANLSQKSHSHSLTPKELSPVTLPLFLSLSMLRTIPSFPQLDSSASLFWKFMASYHSHFLVS